MMSVRLTVGLLLIWSGLSGCAGAVSAFSLDKVQLPPTWSIERYATVSRARSIAVAPELDAVFVGSRGDTVHAVIDAGLDGKDVRVQPVLEGLKVPNGIVWQAPYVYVAEQHRIVRYRIRSLADFKTARPQVLFDALPDDPWHGWRYAAMGPDGFLYVAVGAPCNICALSGLEGTIIRLDPNGAGRPEIYAHGVRNSVGLNFHPRTGDLYFTDNGADGMGDDSPPDEFNHAPKPGQNFGYPFYGGGTDRTPDFAGEPLPKGLVPPVVEFGAHVAALGFAFIENGRGGWDAIVAQHGSWNRSVPDGYRLARVPFDEQGRPQGWKSFAEGWLGEDGVAWGRPVDVKPLPDGSLLVSDDRAGVLYRLSRTPK